MRRRSSVAGVIEAFLDRDLSLLVNQAPNGTDIVYCTTRAFRLCVAMRRILLSWSSGKDSAWSLYVLRQQGEYEIAGLLTTFNEAADRVAMHAVRRELVERQALAAGLPL